MICVENCSFLDSFFIKTQIKNIKLKKINTIKLFRRELSVFKVNRFQKMCSNRRRRKSLAIKILEPMRHEKQGNIELNSIRTNL